MKTWIALLSALLPASASAGLTLTQMEIMEGDFNDRIVTCRVFEHLSEVETETGTVDDWREETRAGASVTCSRRTRESGSGRLCRCVWTTGPAGVLVPQPIDPGLRYPGGESEESQTGLLVEPFAGTGSVGLLQIHVDRAWARAMYDFLDRSAERETYMVSRDPFGTGDRALIRSPQIICRDRGSSGARCQILLDHKGEAVSFEGQPRFAQQP